MNSGVAIAVYDYKIKRKGSRIKGFAVKAFEK